jgi:hypothetical protein
MVDPSYFLAPNYSTLGCGAEPLESRSCDDLAAGRGLGRKVRVRGSGSLCGHAGGHVAET